MRVAVALLLALPAFAHEGWGVVVHPRFGVVVADIPRNTIWRITDDGAEPLIEGAHSHALIEKDGAIYGTDSDTHRVWRFDGRLTYLLTAPELGLQSFLITRDGTIHSAPPYDPRNARGFESIDGMREAADGSLVMVSGAFLRIGTRRIGPLTQKKWGEDLLGLSSIDNDVVHVADHAGRRILRVNLRSSKVDVVDRSSFWWAPAGVERKDNALYALEHLRPPLALLGDLQIGPYLRVRRGDDVLATVWGRRTWIAAIVLLLAVGLVRFGVRRLCRRNGERQLAPPQSRA